MSQLVWLITGSSSGFGELFVQQILARGDRVLATGRSLEKLKHLEQAGAAILQLDVTDEQQALNDTITKAIAVYGKIDVLVNNAAYIAFGAWEDLECEQFSAQFATNVFGAIKVTRAILPHFRQRRSGTIVFIGSLSGWQGHPFVSAYSGSKFALEGLVEGLDQEISPFGIQSLLIEPGRFRTKLLSTDNLKAVQSQIPDYVEVSKERRAGLAKEDQTQPGDTQKAVEIILDLVRNEGCAQGRNVPFRLPLGTDCYDSVKAKCESTLELLEEWRDVIKSTDY